MVVTRDVTLSFCFTHGKHCPSTAMSQYSTVAVQHVYPTQGPSPDATDVQELLPRLRTMLDAFPEEPPFTLQRLCELALAPHKQYSQLDKLVRRGTNAGIDDALLLVVDNCVGDHVPVFAWSAIYAHLCVRLLFLCVYDKGNQ